MSWDMCCRPKKEGGLGLNNFASENMTLAAKWRWQFSLEPHSLWHQLIQSKYGLDKNGWGANTAIKATHSSP